MTAVFAAVHLLYTLRGIRFDYQPLFYYYQYLDIELLHGDLLRSLFYQHSQPPLFNLFLGLVLKAFGNQAPAAFQAAYLAMGLGLYLSLDSLLRRLGVAPWLAWGLATLFLASPAFVLYEHYLFYTFPVAFLLVRSAVSLERFLAGGEGRDLFAFFGIVLLVCGIRSAFHPLYYLAAMLGVALARPDLRRRTLRVGALVLMPLLLLCVKNGVYFDSFGTSSWLGMSVARTTIERAEREEIQQLYDAGKVSQLAWIQPFAPLEAYPEYYRGVGYDPPVPVLTRETKANGERNLNHVAYLAISEQYLADALAVLRSHPQVVLRSLATSLPIYARPASAYAPLEGNRERIAGYERWCNLLLCGEIGRTRATGGTCLLVAIGTPLLLVYALAVAGLALPGRPAPVPRAVMLWLVFNVAYVGLVGNLLEVGENNRFRFMTDPLLLALLGVALQHLVVLGRARRA